MEIYKSYFGKKLSDLLRERNRKQAWLADKIGVEPANVSRWANGHNFPEEDSFYLICDELNVSPAYFTSGPSDKSDLIVSIVSLLPSLDEGQLRSALRTITNLSTGSSALTTRKTPLSK